MTLLLTVFAAVIVTAIWYIKNDRTLMLGVLCWMFWGASVMWLVDAVAEYTELGAEMFTPAFEDMINDAFLGLAVIALALVIWIVILLIKDPRGTVRERLKKKK